MSSIENVQSFNYILFDSDRNSCDFSTENTIIVPYESKTRLTYFRSERLQAFCDAVLAIIATILMTPLKFSNRQMENFNLKQNLLRTEIESTLGIPDFFVRMIFFMSVFFFIVSVWNRHMKIFRIYPFADNFTLWINILFLLSCSFLPLATTFLDIGAVPVVLTILFISTFVIGMVQTIQILYSNWFRRSLFPHSTKQVTNVIVYFQILSFLFSPLLLLVSLAFSFMQYAGPTIATVIIYFLLIGDKSILLIEIFYAWYRRRRNPHDIFYLELKSFNNAVSKFRVEMFTDGIFAIVATIIILDTTSGFNDVISEIKESRTNTIDIITILSDSRFSIYSYVMSFVIVCLFWFVNHSIFHYIRRMNKLMTSINMIGQFFVCLIPFCSNVLVGYAKRNGVDNLSLAITLTCVNLFIISFLQLILWLVVRFWTPNVLTQDLEYVTDLQMLFRLLFIPLLSFIFLFINALGSNLISVLSLFIFFIALLPIFIAIELMHFLIHSVWKEYLKMNRT